MSLTDYTYFVRDINLPVNAGTTADLTASIARYEPDILRRLLGYDLAKLVIAYDSSTSPQRIKDIVEGKEYTEGAYTVKWNGLKNTEKVSLLAYYVFIQYVKDHAIDFQNVGAAASTAENAVNVGPGVLIQRASASMIELTGFSGNDPYLPSLYNFMAKHESDYPEWIWTEPEIENHFGI